jgi:hypothetical protein
VSGVSELVLPNDWFRLGELTQYNHALSPETRSKITRLLDFRFLHNLQQIQDYENGPMYCILLWLPILQNSSEAFLVRGLLFTVMIGAVFLQSFFLVECLRLAATQEPDKDDREKAIQLMKRWAGMKRVPYNPTYQQKTRSGRYYDKANKISSVVCFLGCLSYGIEYDTLSKNLFY